MLCISRGFSGCLARRDDSTAKSAAVDFQPSRVGYGFYQTDEELASHFLRLKVLGGYEQDVSLIKEANVFLFLFSISWVIGHREDPRAVVLWSVWVFNNSQSTV